MEGLNDCKPTLLSFESIRSSAEAGFMTKSDRSDFSGGYAAIFVTVLIWSMPSLFQYYLNRYYDPWAQNFYRYAVACAAIAPFVFLWRKKGEPLQAVSFWQCLLPCLPNVVHQITQVMALFYMGPGVFAI